MAVRVLLVEDDAGVAGALAESLHARGHPVTSVARGADALSASGRLSPTAASALTTEAQRRSDAGEFYGHINYVSAIAAKP